MEIGDFLVYKKSGHNWQGTIVDEDLQKLRDLLAVEHEREQMEPASCTLDELRSRVEHQQTAIEILQLAVNAQARDHVSVQDHNRVAERLSVLITGLWEVARDA